MINALPSCSMQVVNLISMLPITCYVIEATCDPSSDSIDETASNNYDMPYTDIPCSDSAKAADMRLMWSKYGIGHLNGQLTY